MFCTRCGLRVDEGNRFCQSCGQEVGTIASIPESLPPPIAIITPVSTVYPYAGFWIRFLAYCIDGAILGIPFMLVVVIFGIFFGGFGLMMRRRPLDPRALGLAGGPLVLIFLFGTIFFVGVQWLYFAGMESSERQATFGKAAMSLRVADLDGRRLSFGHATGRFFAKIITGIVPLAIGYIMAGFTAKKQALHDMIAGRLVLRKY